MKCMQVKKNATDESGRKSLFDCCIFLMNGVAIKFCFLKLRQATARFAK